MEIDRQIPHSIGAEQGVLGCIFLSPNECIPECIEKLKPGKDVFYDIKHQAIYEQLVGMYESRQAIDTITVHQWLKDREILESVGGLRYLAGLPDSVPSAANLGHYINIVLVKYALRKLLEHCSDYITKTYEHDGEIDQFIDEFESNSLKIRDSITGHGASEIKELVKQRIAFYEECLARGGGMTGLSSGFRDLDRLIDGLKNGDYIVIAARPSVGKTSLAMNIAENVAIDQNLPVGIFSLEMSKESLVGRMVSSRGRVNERSLTSATGTESEIKRTFTAACKVASAPIFIDDTAGLTINQLKAKARRMKQQHKIRLMVIDYVQLLRTAKPRQNRQEEIAEISTGIKQIAKDLSVPVIAICQLNRELEREKDRKPRISDLRESGQIEQDADVIGMLYAVDNQLAASGADVLPVNLLIAKHRNGPTGDVKLTFFKQFTRFESAARIEYEYGKEGNHGNVAVAHAKKYQQDLLVGD